MTQTQTFSIAYTDDALIACVPDHEDIEAAVREVADMAAIEIGRDGLYIEDGLVLTSELQDGDDIRYTSGPGDLSDESGKTYRYAVQRA